MNLLERYQLLMKTGDALFFSGKGATSGIIKRFTDSRFSHVAMVFENGISQGKDMPVTIIESTSLNTIPDVVTGEYRKGVQMQRLASRINSYDGQIWWCGLKPTIDEDKRIDMIGWLKNHHCNYTSYDKKQAIGSALDWLDRFTWFRNRRDYRKLFCSELYAAALQKAALLPDTVNPSEMHPEDIAQLPLLHVPVLIKE